MSEAPCTCGMCGYCVELADAERADLFAKAIEEMYARREAGQEAYDWVIAVYEVGEA